jgi:PncC family amidohydrolase
MAIPLNKINISTAKLLKKNKMTLAAAESCTGGIFSNYITSLSGSSDYFLGSVVSYSNSSKLKILDISAHNLKKYGAVSRQVCLEMALGAKKLFSSDIALSVTGIAGPTGATLSKPAGLVYIALASKNKTTIVKKFNFKGSRTSIQKQAAFKMLCLLNQFLKK